jgi:hypothetical protein
MSKSGWRWFEPAAPDREAEEDARQLARAFARVFSSAEGEAVLAHLKGLTLDRCLGPEAGDAALRHLEGGRALVHHILALVARGRAGA